MGKAKREKGKRKKQNGKRERASGPTQPSRASFNPFPRSALQFPPLSSCSFFLSFFSPLFLWFLLISYYWVFPVLSLTRPNLLFPSLRPSCGKSTSTRVIFLPFGSSAVFSFCSLLLASRSAFLPFVAVGPFRGTCGS